MPRSLLHPCLLGLLLVTLPCCKQKSPSASQHPNVVTIATTQEPDTLLPWFSETSAANQVVEGGIRYLTRYDPQWRLQPGLATRIPTVDNGLVQLLDAAGAPTREVSQARRMRVTWELGPATWADGTPVTARDFVFAHQVVMDSTQEVRDRTVAEKVERMEAPDARTLVVWWKEPFAFYATYRNHPVLPAHHMEQAWRNDGGRPLPLKSSLFAQEPLFFGPFRLAEWKRGQFIRLQRNPHAAVRPALDQVVWSFVPTDQAAVAKLLAGEVDAIAPDGSVGVDLAESVMQRHADRFRVDYQPGMVWAHVDVNCQHPWLADVRMRRALLHALDRETALRAIFAGRYAVSHGLFPPLHPGHHDGLTRHEHGAVKANALLDELGFVRDAHGMRTDGKGQPLVLQMAYATGQRTTEDLLQIFQSNLKDVGITLTLKGMPARVLLGDVLKHRKSTHLAFYASFMEPSVIADTMLGTTNIPTEANAWQGQNYPGFSNGQVDALLTAIPRTLDEAQRHVLLRQLNDLFVTHLPMLPIYTRPVISVVRKDLVGWQPTGTPTSVSWNLEQWKWAQPTLR